MKNTYYVYIKRIIRAGKDLRHCEVNNKEIYNTKGFHRGNVDNFTRVFTAPLSNGLGEIATRRAENAVDKISIDELEIHKSFGLWYL